MLPNVDHACSSGARVGAGEVDAQPLAVDGDRHVQVHVGVAERVVVDPAVGLVGAVGPGRHLLAEAAGGVVDHEVDRLLDGGDAVALDDLAEARGPSCAAPIWARRSPM